VGRKASADRPLSKHASVHFCEPLIEQPFTDRIFLTEIFLREPIEIDFERLNKDKIALAKPSFGRVTNLMVP
jgi:hypothetical protein